MSSRSDQQTSVKRVVLPSGKAIEVVYFEDTRTLPEQTQLHLCQRCGSDLVQPLTWEEREGDTWTVTLRCPECELTRRGTFAGHVIERYDEELDRGSQELSADLRRLAHANMQAEIERFVEALAEDHIQPEDF
jgi:RNase P subunit RPR2